GAMRLLWGALASDFRILAAYCHPHGLSASSHTETGFAQPGHPEAYLRAIASVRSTPATLAIVANQASTSANSPKRSSCDPLRSAPASSPISSISHMNVPSTPRA